MSHPRYHRRVSAILSAGYRVTAYSFERAYYKDNSFPPECELISLGSVEDGHYIRRISKIITAARQIRRAEQKRRPAALAYAFELDCAILSCIAFRNNGILVYEVGDLRSPTANQNLFGKLVQKAEDVILRRCSLLVNTSADFTDIFFEKRCHGVKTKSLTIENKLPRSFLVKSSRPPVRSSEYPLKIGYIGLLRYPNTFLPLLETVSRHKNQYSLHIYGDGALRQIAEEEAAEHSNIFYYGPFRNPEDLASIYESIDLCYVVYDNRDINVRLALPNKLYECTYFCIPMLVASETSLSRRVNEWRVGWIVDPREENFLDAFLDELSLSDVDEKKRNSADISLSHLTEDSSKINDWLKQLVHKASDNGLPADT